MAKEEPIVVVKEVGKSYGTVEALKEVSFVVERGEIFGLISYSCTEIAWRERSRLLRSTCAAAVS